MQQPLPEAILDRTNIRSHSSGAYPGHCIPAHGWSGLELELGLEIPLASDPYGNRFDLLVRKL